ncbi:PGF-CTERM sorting domain-containing protein [Natrarchaeobius chitinivorans]|uniref:PGF-CTERM sorting domain-containing protein n=1 Tax=Natrarchaeobius chitinivorans TaxID=1679083 RepID=A0A3N6PCJ1_NATCH|nr:PGF-CTERM sorting domain-containing protein [Natrarchaeobius chitinivorans]RQG97199.1 PGF-CTERM sorting domain-containing protein [Natrarchaeobius chitinivorans]
MSGCRRAALAASIVPIVLGLLVASGAVAGVAAQTSTVSASSFSPDDSAGSVSEPAYVESVPEPGDAYFEAEAEDGSWISYTNPRDEYQIPYEGDGSGKLCVTLLNEAGEPIVGESVPDTTATIETGDELEWHTHADPFVVEYPLTDNYDRPLDADQFGTHPDLPQGDGYLDSHCLEWHGLPEDETVEYGEIELEGEHADRIEVVGYIQQAHDSWDTDVDPHAAATSYDDAGGWTYHPDGSHGQAVVVLQLEGDEGDHEQRDSTDDDRSDENVEDDTDGAESPSSEGNVESNQSDESEPTVSDETDRTTGFGALAALAGLTVVVFAIRRS